MAMETLLRVRRCRERKRNGKIVLSIEVDAAAVRELLVDGGYLKEWDDGDRSKISRALECALDVWGRR